MKEIRILDNSTINKISAGEVVERPSSVVKELIENSIDAGSSAINVEIGNGGTTLIKVSDNGSGIPKEQVKTAFIRHATSKISKIDDLDYTYSLGFRGEALASIASVSQVEMITKTNESETGYKIEINGGNIVDECDCAAVNGTAICVKNIFYNVPARRKFLKKPATESGYISDIVNKLALSHPEISFKYVNNVNTMIHTSGKNEIRTAVFHVYGKEFSQKMIDIHHEEYGFKIHGLVGRPELSRGNRNYENLFINGRFVKNYIVSQAIEEVYKTRLMIGKFPVFVINLELGADMVDVNVHPAKMEVRFRDDDAVFDFVYNTVHDVLKDVVLIPKTDWNSKNSNEVKELIKSSEIAEEKFSKQYSDLEKDIQETFNKKISINDSESAKYDFNISKHSIDELQELYKNKMDSDEINGGKNILKAKPLSYIPDEEVEQEIMEAPEKEEIERFFNNYKIVGQIFSTYWIVEQGSSIFLIDQHAAHERILFEEIMHQFKSSKVASQRMLQPVALNLSDREANLLSENIAIIKKFGFDIEYLGGMNYAIKGVPFIFKNPETLDFFTEIIDTIDFGGCKDMFGKKINSIATKPMINFLFRRQLHL